MVGWHHRLNGYEFEQILGDGERQGSLVCHSSWGLKESVMTEWLNKKNSECSRCFNICLMGGGPFQRLRGQKYFSERCILNGYRETGSGKQVGSTRPPAAARGSPQKGE